MKIHTKNSYLSSRYHINRVRKIRSGLDQAHPNASAGLHLQMVHIYIFIFLYLESKKNKPWIFLCSRSSQSLKRVWFRPNLSTKIPKHKRNRKQTINDSKLATLVYVSLLYLSELLSSYSFILWLISLASVVFSLW